MRALVLSLMALAAMSSTVSAQSAKTDDVVKQCIEKIAIPGATPARTLKVGNDPKLFDVSWTQPDSTRGRQFHLRKLIDTPALRAELLKCEL